MSALASIEWTEPTTLTEGGEPQVYLAAVSVREIFADPTYQRDLDRPRAEHMAREDHWNVRLLGVIELSDRGEGMQPDRYAVINGQHRVEAARLRDRDMPLVAKVHTGLSIEQEAQLFHEIDASTRRLTTWDRWKARRAAWGRCGGRDRGRGGSGRDAGRHGAEQRQYPLHLHSRKGLQAGRRR